MVSSIDSLSDNESLGRSISSSPGGPARNELTPRSKIKALLAAVDDSEDETLVSGSKDLPRVANYDRATKASNLSSTSSDEEEDEVVIPQGKLASRLRQIQRPVNNSTNDSTTSIGISELESQLPENFPATLVPLVNQSQLPKRKYLMKRRNIETSITTQSPPRPSSLPRSMIEADSSTPFRNEPTPTIRADEPISPGLFMTPEAPRPNDSARDTITTDLLGFVQQSNAGETNVSAAKNRFLELVARKRAEKAVQEIAERKKRAERDANRIVFGDASDEGEESDDEAPATGQTIIQQARPTRKASKKSLEDMKRETQRMSRNMQLTHEAVTKKRITKDSLLARFNFRPQQSKPDEFARPSISSSPSRSPAPGSEDDETRGNAEDTPSTSPLRPDDRSWKDQSLAQYRNRELQAENSPSKYNLPSAGVANQTSLERITGSSLNDYQLSVVDCLIEDHEDRPDASFDMRRLDSRLDKGKGKARENPSFTESSFVDKKRTVFTQPPIRIRPSLRDTKSLLDDDLEILDSLTPPKPQSRPSVFDRPRAHPGDQQRPLQVLRALAHLTSPSRRIQNPKSRASINVGDLQASLQRRAREQAALERAGKLQDAIDRGVIVQTAEEREKDQADLEDLIEKARREVQELTRKEKADAKKDNDGLQNDGLPSSDEDEDYADDEMQQVDVDMSGSEDEGDEEDEASRGESAIDDMEDETRLIANHEMIDVEAHEASDEDVSDVSTDVAKEDIATDDVDEEENLPAVSRRRRGTRILDDDDLDDEEERSSAGSPPSIKIPFIPDLPGSDVVPMGLTQAFAATMAPSQTQPNTNMVNTQTSPIRDNAANEGLNGITIFNSQLDNYGETQSLQLDLDFVQSQVDFDTVPKENIPPISASQYSDIPDPSQDAGFALSSPATNRFVSLPPSTVDTILLEQPSKKGRLRRRGHEKAARDLSESSELIEPSSAPFAIDANAFEVLKKGSRKTEKQDTAFDKATSHAKEMVEDQAEESEDEYAGLGGASDDGSDGDVDEEVNKMMDDTELKVDERKLAAFHAIKERASDEAAVSKLYKDITNGGLRRKRGANELDLSDSDDEKYEARQRAKRLEFARMRKALMEDEKVGKIVKNPRRAAFLRAIEDRGDNDADSTWLAEEDVTEILATQEGSQQGDTDSQGHEKVLMLPPPQPNAREPLRPLPPVNTAPQIRRNPRRAEQTLQKPSSLAQIRESLSFLIEQGPDSLAQLSKQDLGASSDVEMPSNSDDDGLLQRSDENRGVLVAKDSVAASRFASRRTAAKPVIDRLSLKRQESAKAATFAASVSSRLAFQTGGPANTVKVPISLLRRATTQATGGADEHGISHFVETERAAGGGEDRLTTGIRKGSKARMSVNWTAKQRIADTQTSGIRKAKLVGKEKSRLGMLMGAKQETWG
ncbi:hypothetical protein MMC25_005576 [Agyrium rufum]|nr:hypothetical protein [Agyrium rufum]